MTHQHSKDDPMKDSMEHVVDPLLDYMLNNNIEAHDSKRVKSGNSGALSEEQIAQLLSATQAEESLADLHDLATLILYSGMRASECAALRFSHFNLQRKEITVTSSRAWLRVIPAEERILQMVTRRSKRCQPDQFVFRQPGQVFLMRCRRQLAALASSLGLDQATFSQLRCTFMTRWMSSGGDALALARILGHSNARSHFCPHITQR